MKINITFQLVLIGFTIFATSCSHHSNNLATPESVGLSSDTLKIAERKMQEYVDNGKLASIATLVMKDGEIVQRSNIGFADLEMQRPIEDNTIFRIFSMTKPITAVALMTLYDEGKFQLDDKVSKYIPEFKDTKVYQKDGDSFQLVSQEKQLTIRNLLTHTSGISYGWSNSYVDSLYKAAAIGGWDGTIGEKVKILAGLPLCFQPGTQWHYGHSTDVTGYLVEVLSGKPLDEYFKNVIFEPLKMEDTGFFVPEENKSRFSCLYQFDKNGKLKQDESLRNAFNKSVTLFSGGAGLVSTINDYMRFCLMLLNKGKVDGIEILSPEAVKLVTTNQLPKDVQYTKWSDYGLAGAVNKTTKEYSWAGAASTDFWIDPENNMIIITCAQLMPASHSYAKEFRNIVRRALID